MKYLLVLTVVFVAVWLWRNNRQQADHDAATPRRRPASAPARMVECAQCGTHLPESEAVKGRNQLYCSAEHRRLHEGKGG